MSVSTPVMTSMLLSIEFEALREISSLVKVSVRIMQHGMKWNAIHHDLHLSILAGVW